MIISSFLDLFTSIFTELLDTQIFLFGVAAFAVLCVLNLFSRL